jgi:uncharacterized membrane protein YgdD (TMEM256/DUF423 family)
MGAFGAHALDSVLSPAMLEVWDTAVLYHLVHAVALLVVGALLENRPGVPASGALVTAGIAFAVGILLFSGSLYVLALDGPRWMGPVTPLGGVGFILGWLALAASALKRAV